MLIRKMFQKGKALKSTDKEQFDSQRYIMIEYVL